MEKFIKQEGYKSFTKDLCSHFQPRKKGQPSGDRTQYSFGTVFHKPWKKGHMYASDGFHFDRTVLEAKNRFGLSKANGHRICLIKCLGKVQHDGSESITTAFIIVRELSRDEILLIAEKEEKELKLNRAYKALNIDLVMKIQKEYPVSMIGGSAALFLHGIILKRSFAGMSSDLDIILPYYVNMFRHDKNFSIYPEFEERTSGADFKEVIKINGVKADLAVSPKCKYSIINYEGFDFKVVNLEIIMEAKWRYAIAGSKKHMDDCYEISGKKEQEKFKINKEELIEELPF